jgi:hypothetical protein
VRIFRISGNFLKNFPRLGSIRVPKFPWLLKRLPAGGAHRWNKYLSLMKRVPIDFLY